MTTVTIGGRRAGRAVVIAALAAVAAIGVGGERWASAGDEGGGAVALAESVPSVIVPLEPARILDTRTGVGAPAGRVAPGSTLTLQVTGVGGVPAAATGVVLNLTATVSDGAGYVTAYPAGGEQPNASVINYSAAEDVANMVTAQLGVGGALAIFNDLANVHLVADVAGYLIPGTGNPGPQGAVGPQGPAGPAGPGPIQVEGTFPYGTGFNEIATVGGVKIEGSCALAQASLRFSTTGTNLRTGGLFSGYNAHTVSDYNGDASLASFTAPSGAPHYNGLIENVTVQQAYQVEMQVSPGETCRYWGTLIPLG